MVTVHRRINIVELLTPRSDAALAKQREVGILHTLHISSLRTQDEFASGRHVSDSGYSFCVKVDQSHAGKQKEKSR